MDARHGPIFYNRCHYGLSIMPIIVGRECSLGARWVLVGRVCRAPAPLRRANVRGARPCPLPLALPLPARPLGAVRCPRLGAGVFMRGPALSRSPRAPLPLYVSIRFFVCSYVCVLGCPSACGWWWSVLCGPRSSSVLCAVAPMPDAARCPPLPALLRLECARGGPAGRAGASWACFARSALNAPARPPVPSRDCSSLLLACCSAFSGP